MRDDPDDEIYRRHFPQRRTAITPDLQTALCAGLGPRLFRILLLDLERAVQWYLTYNDSAKSDYEMSVADATARVRAASNLLRDATRYRASLLAYWHVKGIDLWQSEAQLARRRARLLDVERAVAEAERGIADSKDDLRLSPGRNSSNREMLAEAVVRIFLTFDVPIVKSHDNNSDIKIALKVAYEAAGIEEPSNLVRDIIVAERLAVREVDPNYPHLFQIARPLAHPQPRVTVPQGRPKSRQHSSRRGTKSTRANYLA